MNYTAKQMMIAVGQTVYVQLDKWVIPMTVIDVKTAYGVPRVLVTPVNGVREAWIGLERIIVPSGSKAVLAR
jgi:hypothetical protein